MNDGELSLHTDKYQINMMYAHWRNGTHKKKVVFEVFFRNTLLESDFIVYSGLERVINYIKQLGFSDNQINYLARQEEAYDTKFLEELKSYKFSGSIKSILEGTIIYPNEPILQIEGSIFETQLLETAILSFVSYQSHIATKAALFRIVAKGDILLEFGSRRAPEADAALWGARAAVIGGFNSTSNLRAGMLFDIETKGTHSHSWIQMHDSEEEAFHNYINTFDNIVTVLIDTYSSKIGLTSAINVLKKYNKKTRQFIVRIDSGDLLSFSKYARKKLDEEGLEDVKICATNELGIDTIKKLKKNGSKIDIWGVGTNIIMSNEENSLPAVYKIVSKGEDDMPSMKISDDIKKTTIPGKKKLYRIKNASAKYEFDLVTQYNEKLNSKINKQIIKGTSKEDIIDMLVPIFYMGALIYQLPTTMQVKEYHNTQVEIFKNSNFFNQSNNVYPVLYSEKTLRIKSYLKNTNKLRGN